MKIDKTKLRYRKKASAIVLNKNDAILLVQLNEYDTNQWNVPGGGIDKGETAEDAVLRELKEELGTDKFEIVERSEIINRYDFPDELIESVLREGRNIRGQEQTQFIIRFLGDDGDISVQEEEIKTYKWVRYNDLKSHLLFPNQFQNVVEILEKSRVELKKQ